MAKYNQEALNVANSLVFLKGRFQYYFIHSTTKKKHAKFRIVNLKMVVG